jgi:hypothetical protein
MDRIRSSTNQDRTSRADSGMSGWFSGEAHPELAHRIEVQEGRAWSSRKF